MTSLVTQPPRGASSRLHRITFAACVAAILASCARAVLPVLPADDDYTTGYAPWWITVVAAFLAIGTVVAGREWIPLRARIFAGWTAAALLLWSSAGVVLDAFRMFFAVTGIPAGDFDVVDWPGFAARLVSILAVMAVAWTTLRICRDSQARCGSCGRSQNVTNRSSARARVRPGYVALAVIWPYPMLKLYWSMGGTGLQPEEGVNVEFPAGGLAGMALGVLLALALTQRWGRILPRWMPLTAGWVASAILLSTGALALFGTVSQITGLTDGPATFDSRSLILVPTVYGSWFVLGAAYAVATEQFQQATRAACRWCQN